MNGMTWYPRVGDVICERQYNGQERRIEYVGANSVRCRGIASGRETWITLANVRRRYKLASAQAPTREERDQ